MKMWLQFRERLAHLLPPGDGTNSGKMVHLGLEGRIKCLLLQWYWNSASWWLSGSRKDGKRIAEGGGMGKVGGVEGRGGGRSGSSTGGQNYRGHHLWDPFLFSSNNFIPQLNLVFLLFSKQMWNNPNTTNKKLLLFCQKRFFSVILQCAGGKCLTHPLIEFT